MHGRNVEKCNATIDYIMQQGKLPDKSNLDFVVADFSDLKEVNWDIYWSILFSILTSLTRICFEDSCLFFIFFFILLIVLKSYSLVPFYFLFQVSDLATDVEKRFPRLNVLLCNAGVLLPKRTESRNGLELTFQVSISLIYFELSWFFKKSVVFLQAFRMYVVIIHYC